MLTAPLGFINNNLLPKGINNNYLPVPMPDQLICKNLASHLPTLAVNIDKTELILVFIGNVEESKYYCYILVNLENIIQALSNFNNIFQYIKSTDDIMGVVS